MTLQIPKEVSLELEELAQRQNAEIGDLLREMIVRYDQEESAAKSSHGSDERYATWGDLLKSAREAGLASPESVDTAARSRAILQTEYADYLVRRRLGNDGTRR